MSSSDDRTKAPAAASAVPVAIASERAGTRAEAGAAGTARAAGTDVSKFTEEGVRDYERRRYRGIDQRIVHARETRLIERHFAAIREAGGVSGGGAAVLDLPCGYGRFSELLWKHARRLVNCDLSFEMVRRAGAAETGRAWTNPGAGPQAPVSVPAAPASARAGIVANAKQGLPFKDGVFDVVFSLRFFHHVHDPRDRETILREFQRVTSGWAIVSFYRTSGFHGLQRRLRRKFHKSRTNIKMIEPGTFEREAAAAGFEVVKVAPLFRGLHAYHLALLKKQG
jgi:SAM-dependent methyltransferase